MDNIKPRRPEKNPRISWFIGGLFFLALLAVALYFIRPSTDSKRLQEVFGTVPYQIDDITFSNPSAGVTLSGTITLPATERRRHPAVILISGSGPQNRDGEWLGHKPFLVIADHLTRQNIAVLRYDDRGFGKSTGEFHSATSGDFSTDVENAIIYLKKRKDIDTTKIGLIGHSDGAMVATMVAARSKDVAFVVLLGAPGLTGRKAMIDRQVLAAQKSGADEHEITRVRNYMETLTDIVITSETESEVKERLEKFALDTYDQIPNSEIPPNVTKDEFIAQRIQLLSSPWFKYFFSYDPAPTLKKVQCPVLALTGNRDVQAPAEQNLPALKAALAAGGNNNVTVKELHNLNHMFQECKTGSIDEYATIDQTFSPDALNEISAWIIKHL